jgi:hypothetical protein
LISQRSFFKILLWLAFAVLLALQLRAIAGRMLPQDAASGELTASKYPYVTIGSKQFHLAPGSRIFDRNNRIIVPNSLPPGATVLYQVDSNGDLAKMWLLTPEEAADLKK